MFPRFLTRYRVDARVAGSPVQLPEPLQGDVPDFAEFMTRYSGCTFNGGLYRVHTAETSRAVLPRVIEEFPSRRGRITCFGFDWIGRQFALDTHRPEGQPPLVKMFEADTGDCLEIPADFRQFHESEAVDYPNDVFVADLFRQWRADRPGAPPLSHHEIAGFQVPMFLGGDVAVGNLEVTDMQVHWSLTAQLWRSTRGLPTGTTVGEVGID